MAIPVNISPAGAGTVTQATVFTWNGPGDGRDHTFQVGDRIVTVTLGDNYSEYDYNIAALTAMPAQGFRFLRFRVHSKVIISFYLYGQNYDYEYAFDDVIEVNPACELPETSFYLTEHSVYNSYNYDSSRTLNGTYDYVVQSVVAEFEPPAHGHGLIYSPARNKLIYDVAVDKLMYYP